MKLSCLGFPFDIMVQCRLRHSSWMSIIEVVTMTYRTNFLNIS
jgi:hypothetical protein